MLSGHGMCTSLIANLLHSLSTRPNLKLSLGEFPQLQQRNFFRKPTQGQIARRKSFLITIFLQQATNFVRVLLKLLPSLLLSVSARGPGKKLLYARF